MTAPDNRKAVPVTILTGFLGAGKTTLLNRILNGDHGLRVAVLVNNFGSINIDADLVVGIENNGEVISLANGCVCCSIRDDLMAAVHQVIERPEQPEYIVLEASGVAEPSGIAITFMDEGLRDRIRLDSIMCVVDASQIFAAPEMKELKLRQIAFADMLILNKADLVSREEIAHIKAWLDEHFHRYRLVEATRGEVPGDPAFRRTLRRDTVGCRQTEEFYRRKQRQQTNCLWRFSVSSVNSCSRSGCFAVGRRPAEDFHRSQPRQRRDGICCHSVTSACSRFIGVTSCSTTVVRLNGEEKSRQMNRCYYGADGKVQKVPLTAPPPEKKKFGLRGEIAESKKEEMTDYMKEAVGLVKMYVPPDQERIQAAKDAGHVTVQPSPGKRVRLTFADYLKTGDSLVLDMDLANNLPLAAKVSSYLDSQKEPVTLVVQFGTLDNKATYAANVTLDAKAKNLKVTIENSGYRKQTP